MRVTDASGRQWLIVRRFAPWRRIVQPLNWCGGLHLKYRATPVARRPKRRAKRSAEPDSGIGGELLEAALYVIFMPWIVPFVLVLLPVAAVEAILRGTIGAVLWSLRRFGVVRIRIDVVASYPEQWGYPSLTVLAVPGTTNANVLERGLRALLDDGPRAFDPKGDPAAQRLLAETRAEILRHASCLVRATR